MLHLDAQAGSVPYFHRASRENQEAYTENETDDEPAHPGDLSLRSLESIYGIDFTHPPLVGDCCHFFSIRDLLVEIENLIQNLKCDILPVRALVTEILILEGFEKKMSQLGLVLFYLDRDGTLPPCKDLLFYRDKEISSEIERRIELRSRLYSNLQIPSGKTHFMMREFARTLLTTATDFNRGGVFAIMHMLQMPEYRVNYYLGPEHRCDILKVLKNMASESGFDRLFKVKRTIAERSQEAIRIDLKLHPDEEVDSFHLYHCCLMSLFFDSRQMVDNPNCFAVSSEIQVTKKHTLKVLRNLIEWVERGYYLFNQKTAIPLYPLMDHKLTFQPDLEVLIKSEDALGLATFEEIINALALETKSIEPGFYTIVGLLSEILRANNASEHLPYVLKLYSSFKHNTLVHLRLSLMEFVSYNSYSKIPTEFSLIKQNLLNECQNGLIQALKDKTISRELLEKIRMKLGLRLWFVSYGEQSKEISPNTLATQLQTISNYKGDVSNLVAILNKSIRLGYLKSGTWRVLTKISDLQMCLVEIVSEVYQSIPASQELNHCSFNDLKRAVCSKTLRIAISNFAALAAQCKLKGRHLNWADLLVFVKKGGSPQHVLETVYGISVKTEMIHCKTPYQFMEQLFKLIRVAEAQALMKAPIIQILTPYQHVWTLSPHSWNVMLGHSSDFHKFVNDCFFLPTKTKLSSPIGSVTLEQILSRMKKGEIWQEERKEQFIKHPVRSHAGFAAWLLESIHPLEQRNAIQIIEEEFSMIELSKTDLEKVLQSIKLKYSVQQLEQLFKLCGNVSDLPEKLALGMHYALIALKIGIVEPAEIENNLRKIKELPLIIDMGDTNYTDAYSEAPFHNHKIIGMSWVSGQPCYAIRRRGSEIMIRDFQTHRAFIFYY